MKWASFVFSYYKVRSCADVFDKLAMIQTKILCISLVKNKSIRSKLTALRGKNC